MALPDVSLLVLAAEIDIETAIEAEIGIEIEMEQTATILEVDSSPTSVPWVSGERLRPSSYLLLSHLL